MEHSSSGRSRATATDAVKVCVRVRPLNAKERQEQTKSCIRIPESIDGLTSNNRGNARAPQQLIVGKDRAFTFDTIFGIDSVQDDLYRGAIEPMVDCFSEGYNATVLAYGQTGTGKTHTMSGTSVDASKGKTEDLQGIIPRVVRDVFAKMKENQERVEYTLRVEYIEIYNEELRDLLHPETPSKQLSIREDGAGNIVMAGVKSEVAQSKEAVFRLLALGGSSRVTGSTLMNEQSSRSHAIFSLILQQRDLTSGECRKAKFHLVDLAGSERAKRTGAVAGRFKESVSINQGLLALGNVISALGDDKRRYGVGDRKGGGESSASVHVPYRDSKLTRLLQDSLGGNAKTLMIACVSPATINFEETLNTLKYANRAKNIKNRPIVNQQTQEDKQKADDEIVRMKEEIALLQSQLQQNNTTPAPSTAGSSRPDTSSSSGKRRHSMAVGTSTTTMTEQSAVEQEIIKFKKRCRMYTDIMANMRSNSVEVITALIGLERDIKPLGRSVQQRLNEIVKQVNVVIQAATIGGGNIRKSQDDRSERDEIPESDDAFEESEIARRLADELKAAKADLSRDEQIFEMKNSEIKRLQALVSEAKAKNEKLVERVQDLERSGQLWSNFGTSNNSAQSPADIATSNKNSSNDTAASPQQEEGNNPIHALRGSQGYLPAKRSSSSRGLFTKRGGTAALEPDEDNVLLGNDEDDGEDDVPLRPKSMAVPSPLRHQSIRRPSTVNGRNQGHMPSGGETVINPKIEMILVTLRAKVEELQQQNGELQHSREESVLRWQLERQQYERQIHDAELTVESLRKANQALEDVVMEEKDARPMSASRPTTSSNAKQPSVDASVDPPVTKKDISECRPKPAASRPPTAKKIANAGSDKEVLSLYDDCVRRLLDYNNARKQVLLLIKEKKAAQDNKDEAHRRLNTLEMQKLRQSMSLRESIADVSQSLSLINEKMQHENRTLDELERLKKLKDRADRKLKSLRQQEEQEDELFDKETRQEMVDLEELIEDLNSHIAFQDAELVAAREELDLIKQKSQLDEESPLDGIAQSLIQKVGCSESVHALALVKKCLEDVARLRLREQQLLHELKGQSIAVDERDAALTQLENALAAARKEFDRRLHLQQQETQGVVQVLESKLRNLTAAQNQQQQLDKLQPQTVNLSEGDGVKDSEWQKLIVSSQKKDEYITDLEKHVVFYKSKAKQMQKQLQQLIRDSAGNQTDHGEIQADNQQLQARIQQLEEANDVLMKDLANAKVYLRLSSTRHSAEGAKVVRISKSDLRELPRPPTAGGVTSPRHE